MAIRAWQLQAEAFSRPNAQSINTQNVYIGTRLRCMCAVSSLSPVLLAMYRLPYTTLTVPSHRPTQVGVSKPVKSVPIEVLDE